MSDKVVNVWPQDVPVSLWSYHLLQPEQRDLLPLMGVRLEWNFVFAFLLGAALVAVFAWQRFRQPSSQPDEYDYEVVKRLAPTQLRGGDAMRQAYFYYAGILVAIYAALTFFGGLVFKAVNYIPMAGLEVDIGRDTLTSPSWPLTLAIGMAGFAPLLKPVEIVETWLRRQVHGWVGVPMQLKERTRRLLLTLDQHTRPAVQKAILANGNSHKPAQTNGNGPGVAAEERAGEDPIAQKVKSVKPWLRILLERTSNFAPLIRKWTELEIMTEAIRDPGSWPDTLVLDELQTLAREQRQTAESALLALEDLIECAYPEESKEGVANGSPDQEAEKEVHARQRRQVETMLEDTVAKIDKSRLELAAILAVYAERSPYLEEASGWTGQRRGKASDLHRSLKVAVKEIAPPERRLETGFWVLILLPPIFCTYALMTRLGLHSPLSDVDLTAMTVFATAALETLQVAVIFWLPVLAVMALRQYLTDLDKRRHLGNLHTRRQSAERMIYYIAIAAVVAAFGLTLLAMFWTALIAENTDRFLDLLYTRKQSAFGVFLPKSVCAAIFACFVVRASERRAQGKVPAVVYGAIAAVTTTAVVLGLNLAWLSGCLTDVACTPFQTLKAIYFNPERQVLYRFYNLTDLIVCFTVVFVAVTNAAWPPHAPETGPVQQKMRERLGLARIVTSVLLVASFAITLALSGRTVAEEIDPQSPAAEPTTVKAGFRADAEPFSYKAGPLSTQRYRGYAADLCYSIFANSPYHLDEVLVTAADRFQRLQTDAPKEKKIDILCDPTTLRFWRNNETIDGYFSPIVFVTGVSYLVRRVSGSRAGTDFAYVENTTAEQVALRACEVNLFGANSSSDKPVDCTSQLAQYESCRQAPGVAARQPPVRLCPFPTYNALTDWFCSQQLGRQQVYFGDREIIQAKFDSWRVARDCREQDVERFAAFYTYEPYALLVSRDQPELARFVQRRVYDFFSHRAKAISLFTTYFPDVQMSPMMANLMLLNGIDEPMYDTVPSYLFNQKSGVEPPSDTEPTKSADQGQ
ncbi:hypothetical protein [Rhizobium jaguaris]|uniref:Uncharacterized protein n=1 Tax=Rhizobium jaguaris TaxID=1312183 RepID=A0A387G1M3_9HYPH|nr:hypothetical protein [Rhizobium jaguaris]AYG64453.1 hypothetical protein CCGE525_37645 [Rhizobium jaguaris]